MAYAVHIAALFLMLVQSVGLCACRMDVSHAPCLTDPAAVRDCPDDDHGRPLDPRCDAHRQQLREVRPENAKPVQCCVVPLLVPGLSVVTADPALTFRHAASAAPPSPVGSAVSLPLLN